MAGQSQIVFVDTPGLFRPRRRLDRAMVAAAWGGAADADIVVLLIEAHRGITDGVRQIVETLKSTSRLAARGAGDQQDRPGRGEGAAGADARDERALSVHRTFLISAEKGHGVEDLKGWLAGEVPAGPWLYPEDQIADLPMRMIAAEITREKLTLRLHQELPYQLTVETEKLGRAQGWLGPDRPDRLCRARWAQGHHPGQEGRNHQGRQPDRRGPSWKSFWAARCICSCR